jgi:hypothetical protein
MEKLKNVIETQYHKSIIEELKFLKKLENEEFKWVDLNSEFSSDQIPFEIDLERN